MQRIIQLFVLFLLVSFSLFSEQNKVFNYDPEQVAVSGVIQQVSFPGPPNYENIQQGDAEEIYWILYLDQGIDIIKRDQINVEEKNITKIQLVLSKNQYIEYKKYIGQKVKVLGILFHGTTAHHKTSILLNVGELQRF